MSENGVMDRPRRSTRNSLASSSGGTPGTPSNSSNPYKKPTYLSNSRGNGGETPTTSKSSNGTPTSSGRGRRGRGRPPGRNSMHGGRGGGQSNPYQHTKPECIAVRVDGRRSTGGSTASSAGGGRRGATGGGRRSTYTSRHDYEYHYGSDFDSDQNESEPEEDDIESDEQDESEADSTSLTGDNDNAESDSDYSVSSTRVTSSRLPSPPVPIWLDAEKVPDIPPLELPNSSDDLLLSKEHVVKAVEIYEPLRRFHQLVRLSPFRFEDFCAALASEDQSSLLAEMHIQLLRSIIREEDANGTLFGPNEVKDSVQAVVYFVDHITWPETIRSYLESDPAWKDVYEAMISVEYPFCGPAVRIKVLGWLVDQFLTTNVVREQLLGDGTILHEDHCRACNRLGELICCESCPAVYHIECLSPPLKDPDNPPDMWKCPVCMKHQIPGVNDCTSEVEKMGLLIRHERLGYDRHGRKYWFLVRRLMVESEDGSDVWYYSTRGLVEDLISRLDPNNYESTLVPNIKAIEEEIYRQMEITEEVTRLQNTQRRKTYLDVENGKDNEGDSPERVTRLKATGLYKLGQENLFKSYVNHFISDPLATSKGKHNEERDRKRHMSHKFSLTTASECKYGIKDLTGCSRQTQISALRGALTHMEAVLPTTLMHVNWPMLRKAWLTSVQTGACASDFSRAMIMISSCIRNAVYNPVWSESAGHVRFSRMSLLEREERKKSEKRDKKNKDDEEDMLKTVPQYTKNPLPIRHQVYKQKGEEYRVHGRWGWLWLSNMRRCKPRDSREEGLSAGPHKHVIQVKNETGKVKTMLIDPGVYSKLMAKRNLTATNNAVASTPTTPASDSANVKPAVNDATATEKDSQKSESSDKLEKDVESDSTIDGTSSSSNAEDGGSKENGSDDVEMKAVSPEHKQEEQQTKQSSAPGSPEVKVEENESNESSKVESSKTTDEIATSDGDSSVEPKKEPMEIDNGEVVSEETPVVNGEVSSEEMEVDKDGNEVKQVSEEKETNKENGSSTEKANDESEKKAEDVMEVEQLGQEQEKSDESKDKAASPTETSAESVQKTEEGKSEQLKEPIISTEESQNGSTSSTTPSTPSADKNAVADDSQSRKFKTDLVNVSLGLASSHRILYPKIARRSDYLDNLLQRRLTLMSLEDKQLKNTYGEEMVLRAKSGLAQFEEEERKREQEKEEYPGEEVVDENLTLGGAYAFCCYSSECRNEAREFMKVKGKNRDRIYERICYSPMCRLKFCLQETTRMKQDRMREIEKEKYYKVYKEIEEKRQYTLEGTTHKVYMKKLPECLTVIPSSQAAGGIGAAQLHTSKKKPKTPAIKYPQASSFRYASSKKPSILVLPGYELKRLARSAGRQFTPFGFFQNQKSGSWGWSLPCGRPVFRTAWQFKTAHASTLATACMQLRILYASIRWDDILAKIPNTDGRHQVHTDTEIITSEILNHRIVGRFMERVQYLRRMQVVPIDAPKTIREITPSRIGLRKRKRAESPDKTEPVVTEDWVDEEKLELWEIRFYGDRIDRKHSAVLGGRFSDSNTPSTRTKSGIAIKQPEKYDPSHNPTPQGERKTYAPASHNQNQQQVNSVQSSQSSITSSSSSSGSSASSTSSSMSDTVDSTIEQVIRNHDPSRATETKTGLDGKTVSAVKTAELMRETIETEMKMQRAVHLSKRDSHAKYNSNGTPVNGPKQQTSVATVQPPTASQQFQMQQNNAKTPVTTVANKPISSGTPTSSKVGGVVVGKKFFANRQSAGATASTEAGILTKRPLQNTITINKGAGGSIQVVKNNPITQPPAVSVPQIQIPLQAPVQVPTTVAVATIGGQQMISSMQSQLPTSTAASVQPQKLSVIRLPDGRFQVKGLLPGQQCYQTTDGKIHVTVPPVVQNTAVVQNNQLNQFLGPNKVLVRLDNNQLAAIQLPAQQNQVAVPTSHPVSIASQVLVNRAPPPTVQSVQQPNVISTTPTPPTTPSTPPAAQQQQTGIARTPGLPISIVSPSKSVAQQQQPTKALTSASPASTSTTSSLATPKSSPTVIKIQSSGVVGGSTSIPTSVVTNATPQPPNVSTPVKSPASSALVTKAATPPVQVSSTPTGPVIMSTQQQQQISTASPDITTTVAQQSKPSTPTPMGVQVVKTNSIAPSPVVTQQQQVIQQQVIQQQAPIQVSTTMSAATQQQLVNMVSGMQQAAAQTPPQSQKLTVCRLPDGRLQVKGLLPGQQCYQTTDGRIHVTSTPVIQNPVPAQTQLNHLLGPNKVLVRLGNNQLAAIQLPTPQAQTTVTSSPQQAVSAASPVVMNKALVQAVQQQQQNVVATSTQPATPPVTPQQTTITRTPGLPISIVSLSKSTAQQQQQPVKAQAPPSPAISSSPKGNPTVIKASSPIVVRSSTPTTTTNAAGTPIGTPVRTPSPAVIATKSAPPPIQVTNTPSGPVIITSQPQISSPAPTTVVVQQSKPSTPAPTPIITATKSQPPPIPQDSTPTTAKSLPLPVVESSPSVSKSTPPTTPVVAPTSVASPMPPKAKAPSKIVAQIFQTPQGPKVVIQGVNPGELTPNQMMQLQAQIQKQLAAQQPQQKPAAVPASITQVKGKLGASTAPAVMPPASSVVVQQQQPSSVIQQHNSTPTSSNLPAILQKHQSSTSTLQNQSPVEVLRSGSSSSVPVTQSPLISPVLPQSPPPPTMVSPAKVLSPPSSLPTLLSPPKSVVGRQDMVAAVSSVREPSVPGSPTILSSPGQPVVVARKSQPRKSPIRPNNIDSPPPMIMSPPPPLPPMVHNNVNSVAMELMRPLNSEQQNILAERRNALKEDIMEKKKAAATQMRLEAQREMQEKLEKQKASIELANSKAEEQKQATTVNDNSAHNAQIRATGAKKRKMENNADNRSSRNSSSDEAPPPRPASSHHAKGPRGKGRGKKGKRKLFCVCKTPYNKDRFYVGCDKCDNWFHGECIGITEEISKDLPEYICEDCKDDKLYCMCKQPYNESQFYIQCDKCEDWFHGRCVGVLQVESESIGDYSCPQCEPQSEINFPNGKKLDAADYVVISRLLKELVTNRSSQPFRKPVTKAQAPNYFSIIKEPMDLQTISIRVEEKHYERLREFIGDVGKIFENCRYYNDSTTDIFRQAENLERFFVQKVFALRQTLHSRLHQVIP